MLGEVTKKYPTRLENSCSNKDLHFNTSVQPTGPDPRLTPNFHTCMEQS